MRPTAAIIGPLLLFTVLATPLRAANFTDEVVRDVDFQRDVAPIFQARCVRCHQAGIEKGDFSLSTADGVADSGYVVAGDPEASHLLTVLVPDGDQPPLMPKEGPPLTDDEVATLRGWIGSGADWPAEYVVREATQAGRDWWSLAPLDPPPAPPPTPGLPAAWHADTIDRYVAARRHEAGLTPNPPADRRTLIRRVSYDLTGLPPTPAEVAAFLADTTTTAYERVVDRLLASPRYGEQWGRHWLDVVRFGESNGFERNVLIANLWPFRDYVIASFNNDKPFDQFIREHLAGDSIAPDDRNVAIGTAFLVSGPYDDVGNQDAAQAAIIRANTIDEMLRATSEAFLGVTLGCARCHDHKFDPLLQRDYYSMYATLAGVRHGQRVVASQQEQQARAEKLAPLEAEQKRITDARQQLEKQILERANAQAATIEATWTRPAVDRYGTEETFAPVTARFVRLRVRALDTNPNATSGFRIDEFEAFTPADPLVNVALKSAGATATGASRTAQDFADAYGPQLAIDGRYAASWLAAGPQLTIEFPKPQSIHRVVFSSDRRRALEPRHAQTTFVGEYTIEISTDGQQWTTVATGDDRQPATPKLRERRLRRATINDEERAQRAQFDADLARVRGQIAALGTLPTWWVGNFEQAAGPFHVFLGGDPMRHGETVVPTSFSILADLAGGYELPADAPESERRRALADWISHPDHPLTARVLANRLWHYHFGTGIVDTPSDFGYMGSRPTHPALLDHLAQKLIAGGWRLKPLHKQIVMSQTYQQSGDFRADAAEVDADSRLLWRFPPRRLTGEEVRDSMLTVAGKLNHTLGGPGFRLYTYLQDNVATYVPLDVHDESTYRRAVYHQNARAARVDVMSDFDCPDPAFAAPRRAATTTPLQALTLLNHRFSLDMAQAFADRLAAAAGSEPDAQVAAAFQLAFARPPTSAEIELATKLIADHGLPAFCRAILNSNEFLYVN